MASTRLLPLLLRPPAQIDVAQMAHDACLVLAARYSAERRDLLDIAATAVEDASYLNGAALARIGAAVRDLDTLIVSRDAECSSHLRTISQLQELLEVARHELLAERDAHQVHHELLAARDAFQVHHELLATRDALQVTTTDLEAAHADLRDERRAHADNRLELAAERSRHQTATDLLMSERAEALRLRSHAARLIAENAQLRLEAAGIERCSAEVAGELELDIDIEAAPEAARECLDKNCGLLAQPYAETAHGIERDQVRDFAEELTDVDACGFDFTVLDEELSSAENELLEPGCLQTSQFKRKEPTLFGEKL